MGFNDSNKVAFVHIPKSAGSSVRKALGKWEHAGIHLTASELSGLDKSRWERYLTIAIVRNPWDRMVSMYHYSRFNNSYKFEHKAFRVCFEEWLIDLYCNHLFDGEIVHKKNWVQYFAHDQLQWIENNQGNIIVDKVIRYENLEEEWFKLFGTVLPVVNKTEHQDYRLYYNDHLNLLISKAFSRDIEKFNYRLDNGKESITR
jgi:hypothetical protein